MRAFAVIVVTNRPGEGRISHLKRRYRMRRGRLKGQAGARSSVGWSILTYNLDTIAIRTG